MQMFMHVSMLALSIVPIALASALQSLLDDAIDGLTAKRKIE
jgi:hypothetical protein